MHKAFAHTKVYEELHTRLSPNALLVCEEFGTSANEYFGVSNCSVVHTRLINKYVVHKNHTCGSVVFDFKNRFEACDFPLNQYRYNLATYNTVNKGPSDITKCNGPPAGTKDIDTCKRICSRHA